MHYALRSIPDRQPFGRATMLGVCLFVISGCSKSSRWMPLAVGKSWTYHMEASLKESVVTVEASRVVPVAGVKGMELTGPLGVSRLAWKSGVLLAESTANARFVPPVPLLAPGKFGENWRGRLTWSGIAANATAEIRQRTGVLSLGPRQVDTLISEITFNVNGKNIWLTTWFEDGVGIVKQEQRTDEGPEMSLEFLAGS